MNRTKIRAALTSASEAARAAGAVMKRHVDREKKANVTTQHDIKLELDVRCQKLIQRQLAESFPDVAVLGEEGETGAVEGAFRWIVDPIDGTVNFTYGIPHACVSIALQRRCSGRSRSLASRYYGGYETILGVVYDPFMDELFDAVDQGPARVNGRKITTSSRKALAEAIVAFGFSKSTESMAVALPNFTRLLPKVRKIRIMGAAALSLSWVAAGRLDAFVEHGVRLWDIAAGGFILERAGGDFFRRPIDGYQKFRMVANNGHLRQKIERAVRA